MNTREKKLAVVIIGIVALWGAWMMLGSFSSSMNSGRKHIADAQASLAAAKKTLQKGREAAKQMQELQQRSLPSDRDKSLTLYKAWLMKTAEAAHVKVNDIKL